MKISIVTPSYNQGTYLERTMCSILDQNDMNLQYIVVDGGSKDDSPSIIGRYADRLAWSISEKDTGHANAINKGFSRTDGEIMAWLNSDDMYFPWALGVVREIFEAFPDIEWISGIPALLNAKDQLIDNHKGDAYFNKWDYAGGRYEWIQQESTFWRRSLWDKAGGRVDESGILMIDGELWTRFFDHAELWRVETLLGGYRLHDTNRAHADMAKANAEMTALCSRLRAGLEVRESMAMNEYLELRGEIASRNLQHSCNRYPLIRWNMNTSSWEKDMFFKCHDWPFFTATLAIKKKMRAAKFKIRSKTPALPRKRKSLAVKVGLFFTKRFGKIFGNSGK